MKQAATKNGIKKCQIYNFFRSDPFFFTELNKPLKKLRFYLEAMHKFFN